MSNTITNVTPQLLAAGLLALRENAILPRLVDKSYSSMAAQRGNVINIPISDSIAARTVTPSVTMNSNVDTSPGTVAVTLDYWYEAPFNMSDTDQLSTHESYIPMNVSEAVKALVNTIDDTIWGKHTALYRTGGTAGTTPFATVIDAATSAMLGLDVELAPESSRVAVLDPHARTNFLKLSNILEFQKSGDTGPIIKGQIGEKLGIDWFMDQRLGRFTAGSSWVTGWAVAGTGTIGASTLTIVNATVTVLAQIKVGDIFALGGYEYAITTAKTTASVTDGTAIVFYPPLKTVIASDDAITVGTYGTQYTVNLMFHPKCFAFASRPLASSKVPGVSNVISQAIDPVSGVALRVELSRQYKQDTYSYDALWGTGVVRKEFGAKILG